MDEPEVIIDKVEEVEETHDKNKFNKMEDLEVHEQSGLALAMKQYETKEVEDESTEEVVVDKVEEKDETEKPLTQEELVVKLKEVNSLIEERNKEIATLKTQDSAIADIELLKKDFVNNYGKVREKYSLPSLNILKDLTSEGDANDKLKEWQSKELKSEIEKKHSLVEGEFEYDPSEASEVGTPSYDWDELTKQKKADIVGGYKARQAADIENASKIVAQQEADIKWLGETVFDGEEKVQEKLTAMNENIVKIAKGELGNEHHPYAVRNMVRGLYFDELAQAKVDKAVTDLKAEYAKLQLYLPTDKEFPTDVSNVGVRQESSPTQVYSKEEIEVSPMLREIAKFAN